MKGRDDKVERNVMTGLKEPYNQVIRLDVEDRGLECVVKIEKSRKRI